MKNKPLLKFELEQAGNPLSSIILYIFGFFSIVAGIFGGLCSPSFGAGLGNVLEGVVYALFLFIGGGVLKMIMQQNIILTHIANELDRQGWDEKEEKEVSA